MRIPRLKCVIYTSIVVSILLPATVALGAPLSILSANNIYPDDGSGTGVLLTGSHVWGNVQTDTQGGSGENITWSSFLNTVTSYNHSFIRGWDWEDAYYSPMPYNKSGSDYNLTSYNTTYSNLWKNHADDLADEAAYWSVMLFQGWSVETNGDGRSPDPWPQHPYKSSNNINGINGDPNSDGEGFECHSMGYSAIRAKQEDYVEWMIDQLNSKDNIVWQITNESYEGSVSWQYHMIDHIHSYEAAYKSKQHLVWMDGYDFPNSDLFVSNADILSPNRHNGDGHYRTGPNKNTTGRIVCLDTDHLWGVGGDYNWVWRAFVRGYHPIYMDPLHNLSWNTNSWNPNDTVHVNARKGMGVVRVYSERLDFSSVVPNNARADSGYCLADPGDQYMAYQHTAGNDLAIIPLPTGTYYYEWVDPINGDLEDNGVVTGNGSNKTFNNPTSTYGGLYVVNIDDGISNDLGRFNDPRGLREDPTPTSTGDTIPATIGGRDCRTNETLDNDKYIYFDIDDDWAYQGDKTEVWVTLEYYDNSTTGYFRCAYDGSGGFPTQTSNLDLTGTNTWKTHTWHITDAYFGNRGTSGNDFRIYRSYRSIHFYVDKVSVTDIDPNPSPPDPATNPSPANSATIVSITTDLSWTAGSGATSHDVYFGTDSTPDAGEFKGNQSGVTYDPGTLSLDTTTTGESTR
ncbi:MAG: hypothetical protein ACYTA5_14745 [Planctomycetota bacterium]